MGKLKERGTNLIKERIGGYKGKYIQEILYQTIGANNWRKMHGFSLMRGEMQLSYRMQQKEFKIPERKKKKLKRAQNKSFKAMCGKYRRYKVRTSKSMW